MIEFITPNGRVFINPEFIVSVQEWRYDCTTITVIDKTVYEIRGNYESVVNAIKEAKKC